MKKPTYMSWENFSSTFIVKDERRTCKVSDAPRVEFFWDGAGKRIGMWLETPANTVLSPELLKLSFISASIVRIGSRKVLEIATASMALRRQFYHFATAVTERVVLGSSSSLDAVTAELLCFADLLAERSVLSIERQIGLLGELLFLERLTMARGVQMLDSWIGPDSEPHDFRVGTLEFEVKTTVTSKRIHVIHGGEQLVPSKGCSLFLLSILLGPPGTAAGFSLAGKVQDVGRLFASDTTRSDRYFAALEKVGLRMTDLPHYDRNYSLRRALAVVPVDKLFPALTRPAIKKAMGVRSQRIESLQYAVNLEGLEKEEGTPQFSAVVPA